MVGVADKKGIKVRGKKGRKQKHSFYPSKAMLLQANTYAFARQKLCYYKKGATLYRVLLSLVTCCCVKRDRLNTENGNAIVSGMANLFGKGKYADMEKENKQLKEELPKPYWV